MTAGNFDWEMEVGFMHKDVFNGKKLIIIGAGGYGRVVADIAEQSGIYGRVDFLDDNSDADDVIGRCDEFLRFAGSETEFYPAFGNNELRLEWVRRLQSAGCIVAVIVHSSAYVSPRAVLAAGTAVLPKAVINTSVMVGEGVIINCGAVVDHDCVIGAGAHICLGAVVKARNQIPAVMKVEAGVVVENGVYQK